MGEYERMMQHILDNGIKKDDRTGVGTIGVFGYQSRYDLRSSFPLLTTKKVYLKGIIHELLWFLQGDTNIKYLVDNNVNIWNEWPYEVFKKSDAFNNETLAEFVEKIRTDETFAKAHGNLGPVYGKQWRDFNGVDQIAQVIDQLKNSPNSRRIIVSAWNPAEVKDMALPPCHTLFQFNVANGELSCQLYQRSCDAFLGVPFNIASYALLTLMMAKVTGLKPGEFVHTYGDLHIYLNHLDQVKEQLSREPRDPPKMLIKRDVKDILDFKYEDFELIDYNPHPPIKAPIAV